MANPAERFLMFIAFVVLCTMVGLTVLITDIRNTQDERLLEHLQNRAATCSQIVAVGGDLPVVCLDSDVTAYYDTEGAP